MQTAAAKKNLTIFSIFKKILILTALPAILFADVVLFEQGSCTDDFAYSDSTEFFHHISTQKAKEFFDEDTLFIDARPETLYKKGTIKNSVNIPIDQYDNQKESIVGYLNKNIVVFCSGIHCGKSIELAQKMKLDGFDKIYILTEGYPGWKRDGYPTQSEENVEDPYRMGTKEFNQLAPQSTVIDVRAEEEYRKGHFKSSVNIPIKQESENFLKSLPKKGRIIFICATGLRAFEAVELAKKDQHFQSREIYYYDGDVTCDENNRCTFVEFEE